MQILNNYIRAIQFDSKGMRLFRIVFVVVISLASINPAVGIVKKMFGSYNVSTDSEALVSTLSENDETGDSLKDQKVRTLPIFGEKITNNAAKDSGFRPISEDSNAESKSNRQESQLNLVLKGIIGSVSKGKALAIINIIGRTAEDNVYSVGDMVPGNAEIEKIFNDRVLLSFSGKIVTLYLAEEDDKNAARGSINNSIIKSSPTDKNSYNIDKKVFQSESADLVSLSKKIGVQIYKVKSLQKGYRLTSPDGVLLKKIGLVPGDIVLEVNGVKLLNTRLGIKALNIIRKEPKIRLTIDRRGVRKKITYNIM